MKDKMKLVSIHRFRNDKGSMTIEASLIFPIIFILIIAFLFISIVVYQRVTMYYLATNTAERLTYTWNNSYKDPITGAYTIDKNDGLYWRLTNDRILDLLVGITGSDYSQITIASSPPQSLPERKMFNMAKKLPNGLNGTISYKNNPVEHSIIVKLENPLKIPSFVARLIGNKVQAVAYSRITDPVGFIRNVDLIGTYAQRIQEERDKAKQILDKQKEKEREVKRSKEK